MRRASTEPDRLPLSAIVGGSPPLEAPSRPAPGPSSAPPKPVRADRGPLFAPVAALGITLSGLLAYYGGAVAGRSSLLAAVAYGLGFAALPWLGLMSYRLLRRGRVFSGGVLLAAAALGGQLAVAAVSPGGPSVLADRVGRDHAPVVEAARTSTGAWRDAAVAFEGGATVGWFAVVRGLDDLGRAPSISAVGLTPGSTRSLHVLLVVLALLMSAAVAPAAYLLGVGIGGSRSIGAATAVLSVCAPPYLLSAGQPLVAVAVLATVLATGLAARGARRHHYTGSVLGGAIVSLATFSFPALVMALPVAAVVAAFVAWEAGRGDPRRALVEATLQSFFVVTGAASAALGCAALLGWPTPASSAPVPWPALVPFVAVGMAAAVARASSPALRTGILGTLAVAAFLISLTVPLPAP